LSRLRIFILFAALAALATVFAACGSDDDNGGGSDESPEAVLEGSTFEGIESGDLDLSMNIDVSGEEGGTIDVTVSGPFQSKGKGQIPELDMTAAANGSVGGKDVDFEAGVVLVPSKAFVSYDGQSYEVDPTTFSFVQSAIEEAQRKSGAESGTEGATKCQEEAAGKFSAEDFVDNLTNDGSADVGGAETTKISGDLNVPGALEAVTELTELPACSSQLEAAGPLPLGELEEAQGEIEKAVKSASAEVYVGEDKIIRRFTAEVDVQPEGSDEAVRMEIDLTINGVNEEQEIGTPDDAKPLNDLFEKLGVNPIELLQGAQGGKGLGGLLEGLGGAGSTGGGSGGGGSAGTEMPPGLDGAQSEYLECVQGASTPVDLQNCAKKLQ
jgi:hypothetical protein